VDLVGDMLVQGATAEEILEGYPSLNEEMLLLAPLCSSELSPQATANRSPWRTKKSLGE
jgi:uncharacterized protein (DUF433 family)